MTKQNLSQEEFEKLREELREESGINEGYKCSHCGARVNMIFPMEFLKKAQQCPDCFSKDDYDSENKDPSKR